MNTSRIGKLNEMFPHRTNEAGKKLCRKCGKELSGRRTAWCSDECNHEAMVICYPSFARAEVWKRDRGVCAICGRDMTKLQQRYWRWKRIIAKKLGWSKANEWERRWEAKGYPGGREWWDADHIIPVVEGGGGCGLENYRTACVPCHKKETAELAKRRARARRKKQEPTLTQQSLF